MMEIKEIVSLAFNGVILCLLSAQDIKKKKVGLVPVLVLAIVNAGLAALCGRTALEILCGLIPGVMALGISVLTGGKLGTGDGLVLMGLGLLYGWDRTLLIWFAGLFLSAVTGMILLGLKKVKLKTAIPFVPFICLGFATFNLWEKTAG